MNRIFAVLVGVALIALVAFGVLVFTSGGPPSPSLTETAAQQEPAPAAPSSPTPSAEATTAADAPQSIPEMRPTSPEAAQRFDAWAKPLRDRGLTVTAGKVAAAGETVSVTGLTIAGPPETPGWRWTSERASLYDRGLFHLQTAGKTEFVLIKAPGQETVWSGSADAVGIALKRDPRDVLARSIVVRINGLAIATAGDTVPLTLADGQLRILLKGGTGLLTPGTDMVLSLMDLNLPFAAGSALGAKLKSFTTEFAVERPITAYSLQQVLDFFAQSGGMNVNLGSIATDWGALHFTGNGVFGLSPAVAPRGRFEVEVNDPVALLDSIVAAAGEGAAGGLADQYAALLLEMGRHPDEGVPMVVTIGDGAIVLEGPGGDIRLWTASQSAPTQANPSPAELALPSVR